MKTPLDPTVLSKLKAHEAHLDDEAPFSPEGNPLIELTPELAAQLRKVETLSITEAEILRHQQREARKNAWSSMLRRSQPLTIGLRGDCLPHPPDLDIRLEETLLPNGDLRTVAWVPCILHLVPRPSSYTIKNGPNAGKSTPTLEMGKTTIRDSFATIPIPTIHPDPKAPTQFLPKVVALSGFCSITIHSSDPTELHNALHEAQGNLPLATPSDFLPPSSFDPDPDRDASRLQNAHPDETPTSLNSPAFIPSNPHP